MIKTVSFTIQPSIIARMFDQWDQSPQLAGRPLPGASAQCTDTVDNSRGLLHVQQERAMVCVVPKLGLRFFA